MADPPSFEDTTGGPPVLAPSRAAIRRLRRARRRRRRVGFAMVALGLAIAGLGVAAYFDGQDVDPLVPSVQSEVTIRSTTVPDVTVPEPTVP